MLLTVMEKPIQFKIILIEETKVGRTFFGLDLMDRRRKNIQYSYLEKFSPDLVLVKLDYQEQNNFTLSFRLEKTN